MSICHTEFSKNAKFRKHLLQTRENLNAIKCNLMELTTRSVSHPLCDQQHLNRRMHQDSMCSSPEDVVALQRLAHLYALVFLCAVGAPIIGCNTLSALSASCFERSLAFPRSVQNATNLGTCDEQQCSRHVGSRPGVFLGSSSSYNFINLYGSRVCLAIHHFVTAGSYTGLFPCSG